MTDLAREDEDSLLNCYRGEDSLGKQYPLRKEARAQSGEGSIQSPGARHQQWWHVAVPARAAFSEEADYSSRRLPLRQLCDKRTTGEASNLHELYHELCGVGQDLCGVGQDYSHGPERATFSVCTLTKANMISTSERNHISIRSLSAWIAALETGMHPYVNIRVCIMHVCGLACPSYEL